MPIGCTGLLFYGLKKIIYKNVQVLKYHNHTLQTNPWHRDEESQEDKVKHHLSHPYQDDYKSRKDDKYYITK